MSKRPALSGSLLNHLRHQAAALSCGLAVHTHYLGQRKTTIKLDHPTWCALLEIVLGESVTVHELCAAIDAEKPPALTLTVAIRLGALRYYRDAATEEGHAKARHGKTIH